MEKFHVLIVGAGITGLLLAHALKKAGIECSIFESELSADTYRPRQWGLSIHWSTPILKKILPPHLWARIHEAQTDPAYKNPEIEHLNIYDGTTGQKMNSMAEPNHFRFNRGRLRALCAQKIEVQYNKRLVSIAKSPNSEAITATFQDGTSATGSMLVGADGPSSRCRHVLLGEEKAKAQPVSTPENPFTIVNHMIRYPKPEQAKFLRQLHPLYYMALHPDGGLFAIFMQDIPDLNDPTTWVFQLFMSWRGAPPQHTNVLPELKAWAPKIVDPWKSAIEWIPDDAHIELQKISYWHPIMRDNWGGRVTLLGDAAHPMVPYRGQGLSHCIADVASLSAELRAHLRGQKTLEEAITQYDAEVLSRAGDEINTSLQAMNFMMTWDLVEQSPSFRRSIDPNGAALKIIGRE